ncbi:MAG: multidrug efflux transporter [Gammaproteobacteria bacterium]|jgi:small multidrug resistance pump|nr:multidrug efflux transporter [Gammaproteobacteria bacterium]
MKEWFYLFLAILLEVLGTTSMKLSQGFTNIWASVLVFVFYSLSFIAFTFALKRLELSTSYAIWAAVGTAAVTLIGVLYFNEPINAIKIISILLIILGVVGLRLEGIA